MDRVFPNAIDARNGSRNNVRIYEELRHLEAAVLDEIALGNLSATVSDSYMTDEITGLEYCAVWLDELEDRAKAEQMLIIERHFENLGYDITKKLASSNAVSDTVSAVVTVDGVDPVDPDLGIVEVQTITVPIAEVRAIYTLAAGGTSLSTQLLTESPSLSAIEIALKQDAQYSDAPFTITTSGEDLVLTWKEAGDVTESASMRYSYVVNRFFWEILW